MSKSCDIPENRLSVSNVSLDTTWWEFDGHDEEAGERRERDGKIRMVNLQRQLEVSSTRLHEMEQLASERRCGMDTLCSEWGDAGGWHVQCYVNTCTRFWHSNM